jgi:eukaryotic-like serine/threonine-protein kinase
VKNATLAGLNRRGDGIAVANFKERMQWLFRMALLVFVLASVAFLSALTAMRFAIQGREVAMPDVAGHKAIEAQQILQGRGIGMKVEDRIYSQLPVDEVVRQSPPPRTRVKIGQFAHVVLSLGPQKATIPDLQDQSIRAARIELLRDGLQVGEISSAYLADTPSDTVLRQDPAPGTSDTMSSRVNLLVSLGTRPSGYAMPELVGLTLGEAQARLGAIGLKLAKLSLASLPGALHGTVVGQSVPRGTRVEAGSAVELQVAE